MVKERKPYHKFGFSADAKILISLIRKQPQTKKELSESAGIDISTVHRNILTFLERGIIKETKGRYALSAYVDLEGDIEKALDELEKTESRISLDKIASEVGVDPDKIKPLIYRIAKKRGMEVQHEKGVIMVVQGNGVVLF
jgi:Fe2+ or Zn2+ uptake regulation protein